MMSAISVAHLGCKDMDAVDVGVVAMVDSQSLSSALEKLYFWERKLYAEVKVWSPSSDKELSLFLNLYYSRTDL
jgi:hypothetical protein